MIGLMIGDPGAWNLRLQKRAHATYPQCFYVFCWIFPHSEQTLREIGWKLTNNKCNWMCRMAPNLTETSQTLNIRGRCRQRNRRHHRRRPRPRNWRLARFSGSKLNMPPATHFCLCIPLLAVGFGIKVFITTEYGTIIGTVIRKDTTF